MSTISKMCGELSNTCLYSAAFGAVGYLGARVVKEIDPMAGLICGAVAGATTALFFHSDMRLPGMIAGIAILIGVPFKLCEKLKLPATFQGCLIVTGLTAALAIFVQHMQEESDFEAEVEKMDKKFHANAKKMHDDFGKKSQEMHDDFEKKSQQMKDAFEQESKKMHEKV